MEGCPHHIHSPISRTLPLSSPKGDGFATTPARGRRLPVRASVNWAFQEFQFQLKNLRRSATEAQLGLDSEHEHEFALDAGFEFAFESEHDDSNSNLRWRVSSRSDSSSSSSCSSFLRKLALLPCELELLRSHPKDERGSVREIGLCARMCPTLHFSELSPTARTELTCCSKWSFSVPLGGPFRTSFGNHFGPHLETISDLILDRKLTRGDSISNSETSIRTQMRTRQFKLSKSSSAV